MEDIEELPPDEKEKIYYIIDMAITYNKTKKACSSVDKADKGLQRCEYQRCPKARRYRWPSIPAVNVARLQLKRC